MNYNDKINFGKVLNKICENQKMEFIGFIN